MGSLRLILLGSGLVGTLVYLTPGQTPSTSTPVPQVQGNLIHLSTPLPSWGYLDTYSDDVVVGGPISPDGKWALPCYLPPDERKHNTGGTDGAGLCVFTSIEYCARFQNVRELMEFQKWMTTRKGGGHPQKVDQTIKELAPGVEYGQYEGADTTVLYTILESGRPAAISYCGFDPHYGQKYIYHMVFLGGLNQEWAAVIDNNFPADDQIVWMRPNALFSRWKGQKNGWCVFLLKGPPPPHPFNSLTGGLQ